MAFMRAYISNHVETWCFTEDGAFEVHTILPDGEYFDFDQEDFEQIARDNDLEPDEVADAYDQITSQIPASALKSGFVIATGYRGWLAAPGYLDHTDPVIGDTREEAAQLLLDQYFDHEVEYMDDDELEDAIWLANLAGDEEALARFEEEDRARRAKVN